MIKNIFFLIKQTKEFNTTICKVGNPLIHLYKMAAKKPEIKFNEYLFSTLQVLYTLG